MFLSRAALAAIAVALAACGSASPTAPATVARTTLTLASYPALATVGGVAYVDIGGSPLAVVRAGEGSFLALSRICPHKGFTVDAVSSGFYCPGHGAQFNSGGQWIGGQPTSNLVSYPTSYDAAAGTLTIGG